MNKNLLQAIKFTLFSISAGIVQVASFAVLHDLIGIEDYWLCYLPSLVLSVLWNFTFNRRYTFQSTENIGRAMLLVGLYYCAFTPLSTWLEHVLAGELGWNEYLVTFLNMLLNMVTEFVFQRFVVYRKSIDTNELANK